MEAPELVEAEIPEVVEAPIEKESVETEVPEAMETPKAVEALVEKESTNTEVPEAMEAPELMEAETPKAVEAPVEKESAEAEVPEAMEAPELVEAGTPEVVQAPVEKEERQGGHVQDPIFIPDHQHPRVDLKEITQVLRVQFGLNPQMANHPAYQRPFPERIINDYPLPRNYRPPDFHAFSGEDGSSTIEHVGRFTTQLREVGNNTFYKLQLFGLSLTRTAFSWFVNLPPGQIQTWEGLEMAFHARFFNPFADRLSY
ncbi:uncharacterized protein LOC127258488 [Andrographis paniculata]|uniref:uncharacterized protein LOC127258488 n=1 Tax=Andrographis paniculata TaxID=175694 RepID=UPI0021E79266|nr:uncharacterized protein LOC127258488 [Andrographis paniculata]